MLYRELVNGTKSEIYAHTWFIESASIMNQVSTKLATWFQSKLFTSEVPTSHPLQTQANLKIRLQTIIISILVLIPVINLKKWYISFLSSFSPLAQWTQWGTVMIHTLFSHMFLVKNMHKPGLCFQVGLRFFMCQFSWSNFWVERKFQAIVQTLFDAGFRINSHKNFTSLSLWYHNISTYTVTCSSQLKWISGFILYTLYSSEHCASCSLY